MPQVIRIPVVVQHRHIHLSPEDHQALFGSTSSSGTHSQLGHLGQAAMEETVSVIGPNGRLDRVRVLGPSRAHTQLELSPVEAVALGVDAPLRVSGDTNGLGRVRLKGPAGEIRRACAMVPVRHLHVNEKDAARMKLTHGETVTVQTNAGEEIEHAVVRVHPTFGMEYHVMSDEAAEYWLSTGDDVTLTT